MTNFNTDNLPGVHISPNIQRDPDGYELENRAADPDQFIEAAMASISFWDDKIVLDLGAGTGYHIERFHRNASHIIAVEPHGPSRLRAMARVADLQLERVSIMTGSAERIFLPDKSVDMVHARFAYFFAPGCELGLVELERVLKPGGIAFIIDNDLIYGTFASWLRRSIYYEGITAEVVEKFWSEHGFSLIRIPSRWQFSNRADLETVVRNNFSPTLAELIISEHTGLEVDYYYDLFHRYY
jgi:ubiquinone/menaquinone biosynthesis C-methylase UbiE